jgi:hypothetical protein
MKKLVYIILILALVSCINKKTNSVSINNCPIPDTTALFKKIELSCSLPENFKLDSIKYFDKKRNSVIIISLPISGIGYLDSLIRKQLVSKKDSFSSQIDEFIKNDSTYCKSVLTSDFFAGPVSMYSSNKLISYSFVISSYYSLAPHEVSDFLSFNYDIKKKKMIEFDDYFSFKTKLDSTFFEDIITKAINREGIALNNFKNIDFNIEGDTISFNFGHYEISSYAEGLIQAHISKIKLINNIKLNYR